MNKQNDIRTLFACCLINLSIGVIYAWSVFSTPLYERVSAVSPFPDSWMPMVFTVNNFMSPVMMITGGLLRRRFGARGLIRLGAILFGVGLAGCGVAQSYAVLLLCFGVLLGLGIGCIYGCTVSTAVSSLPGHPGLAGGLATACYGLASVLMSPLARLLTDVTGITSACLVIGSSSTAITLLFSFFVTEQAGADEEKWKEEPAGEYRWDSMMKTKRFYLMFLLMACGTLAGLMVVSQAADIAQKLVGMGAASAALAVSAVAFANAVGRACSGIIADTLGSINTLRIAFIGSIVALSGLLLCGKGDNIIFLACILVVGLCFGAVMGVYPSFTASQFGKKNNNTNYGIMFFGFSAASFFGPVVAGMVLEHTGTYSAAFICAMFISFVGLLLTVAAKPVLRLSGVELKIVEGTVPQK